MTPNTATRRPALTELLQPAALAVCLETAFAGVRGAQVAVAVGLGRELATAALDPDGKRTSRPVTQPIGCLAKLLTATLALDAVADGCFEVDSDVAEFLGTRPAALRGVSFRHLLEHTHGLDDSLFRGARRRHDGRVDLEDLLGRVERLRRFARPGVLYHYGHVGAWLTAAVLERLRCRSYGTQVRDGVLAPLDVRERASAPPMDPANATGTMLDAATFVRFLERRPGGDGAEQPSITPLPGWNPLERGVHLGWKYSRGDWFGHQSVWPNASAYVRVQRTSGFALAVLSRTHAAAVVARRMFGAALPELFELRPPPFERGVANEPRLPVERFEQAAHVVHLEASRLRVRARDARGRLGRETLHALRPTAGEVLFVDPPHAVVPYVQLVRLEDARWLWTGRAVLRRST